MNGNEVSCISDFYDIENLAAIEDTMNLHFIRSKLVVIKVYMFRQGI